MDLLDSSLHKTTWLFWGASFILLSWVGHAFGFRVTMLRVLEVGFALLALTLVLLVCCPALVDRLEVLQHSPIGHVAVLYYRRDIATLFSA